MLKKLKIILFSAAIILGINILYTSSAKASDVNGLAMQPVYPSNQIVKNGILNPRVKPGTKQNLSFNIINLSNQDEKITVQPNTAITSGGPAIDYSHNKYNYDKSLKYNFGQIFSPKKLDLTVKSNKPTKVTFTANIPKNKFKGLLMGGFYITTSQISYNTNSSTSLNNKYTYAMPVIMREDNVKSVPKLSLGDVTNGNSFKTPIITSSISNKEPAMIDRMSLDTTIKDPNSNTILHKKSDNNSVAPNSNFKYVTPIDNKDNLDPGKYHIKIIAKSPEGKWILEKDFTVTVGQYLGTIIQNNQWIWLILALIILLIISLIGYLIYRKRRRNNQSNNAQTRVERNK